MDMAPYKPIIKNTKTGLTGGPVTFDKKYPGVTFPSEKLSQEDIDRMSGPVEVYTIEELERRKAAE